MLLESSCREDNPDSAWTTFTDIEIVLSHQYWPYELHRRLEYAGYMTNKMQRRMLRGSAERDVVWKIISKSRLTEYLILAARGNRQFTGCSTITKNLPEAMKSKVMGPNHIISYISWAAYSSSMTINHDLRGNMIARYHDRSDMTISARDSATEDDGTLDRRWLHALVAGAERLGSASRK